MPVVGDVLNIAGYIPDPTTQTVVKVAQMVVLATDIVLTFGSAFLDEKDAIYSLMVET